MPIDVSAGQNLEDLERRRKLAQSLQQQATQPVQNNFQALTSVLSNALGTYSEDKINDERSKAIADMLSQSGSLSEEQKATLQALGPDAGKSVMTSILASQLDPSTKLAQQKYNQSRVNDPFLAGENGEVLPNQPVQSFQLGKSRAGATNVNVKLPAQQKAFDEKFGGAVGERIVEGQKEARQSAATLRDLDTLRQIAASGALQTGFAQEQIDTLRKLGSRAGFDVNQEGLNANELFKNISRKLAVEGLRDFGGSDTERELIESVKINPNIVLEPGNVEPFISLLAQPRQQKVNDFINDVNTFSRFSEFPENVQALAGPDLQDLPRFEAIDIDAMLKQRPDGMPQAAPRAIDFNQLPD